MGWSDGHPSSIHRQKRAHKLHFSSVPESPDGLSVPYSPPLPPPFGLVPLKLKSIYSVCWVSPAANGRAGMVMFEWTVHGAPVCWSPNNLVIAGQIEGESQLLHSSAWAIVPTYLPKQRISFKSAKGPQKYRVFFWVFFWLLASNRKLGKFAKLEINPGDGSESSGQRVPENVLR